MSNIRMLTKEQINLLGSGEILPDVKSFIKELMDNSIDAESSEISIHILLKENKINKIEIKDNGKGISKEEF